MIDAATRLEVHLPGIAANWRALVARQHAAGGGQVAAVVKADGYGLGARPVAERLYAEGCRDFFVAHAEEGARLSPWLPEAAIIVLHGLHVPAAADYAAHGLIPVLGSLAEIDGWTALARSLGQALPALLHVDTGMNRLGLPPTELAILADDPGRLHGIDLRYVMTHLVAAEEPAHPMNARQLARFAAARAMLPAAPASIANSSGMFLPGAESDLSRPGAALYGLNPTPGQPNPMHNVVRLMARVIQLREVPAGETVGYNGIWTAQRASRVATVAVGYADGYLRALSNRALASFDGRPVPLVGRVSMDLTTYDVTDHPTIAPGDWLELIGPSMPPDRLAEAAGTNGYEILTSLGDRYHRMYLS